MENTVKYNEDEILFLNSISDIKKKNDGSFIVNYNNMPYHIPNTEEFQKEYNLVNEYVKNNPTKCSDYIEPEYTVTPEQKAENIRYKRNQLLNEVDTLFLKYQEQVELGIITANETYRLDLLKYKQSLRDISEQQDFPENVEYPVLPKYEDYI